MLLQNSDSHENRIVGFQVGIFIFSSVHQQISGTYCVSMCERNDQNWTLKTTSNAGSGGEEEEHQPGNQVKGSAECFCFQERSHIRMQGVCREWDSCLCSEEHVFPGHLGSVRPSVDLQFPFLWFNTIGNLWLGWFFQGGVSDGVMQITSVWFVWLSVLYCKLLNWHPPPHPSCCHTVVLRMNWAALRVNQPPSFSWGGVTNRSLVFRSQAR